MFRIDHPSAAEALPAPLAAGTPGFFSRNPPTLVTADWANMMQEENMAILAAAAIDPDKADHGQVLAAIQALITAAINGSVVSVIAENGYRKYSDGFIEQWGVRPGALGSETTYEIDFNIEFPNACFGCIGIPINASASDEGDVSLNEVSLTTAHAVVFANNEAGSGSDASGIRWWAWGH